MSQLWINFKLQSGSAVWEDTPCIYWELSGLSLGVENSILVPASLPH
jgi:hypothetical protein